MQIRYATKKLEKYGRYKETKGNKKCYSATKCAMNITLEMKSNNISVHKDKHRHCENKKIRKN